jgi:hypothetical protein
MHELEEEIASYLIGVASGREDEVVGMHFVLLECGDELEEHAFLLDDDHTLGLAFD